LFNPSFPQDELDKWKDRQLSQLQQIRAQPAFLGQERFFAVMYPSDNRSIVAPTPESIGKITRDLIIDYYNTNFRPEGGRVAVSGDISAKEIAAKLDKTLGNWKGSAPKPPDLPLPGAIADKKIYLINRPNSVQSNVYIGNLAIDRLNPDYIPVMVMNHVLGGGPASRLFRNIREEKGYTYGISSGFSASHYINYFVLSTSVRTEVTGPALEEIFKELRDIRDRPEGRFPDGRILYLPAPRRDPLASREKSTRTVTTNVRGRFFELTLGAPVVATTEIFFQPHVDANKQISAAHLADLEFGDARSPVSPGDGNDGPIVAADNCLQRQFDRQVEVGRKKWTAAFDDFTRVSFKRVSRIVQ
jgi:predicted Zn-dependent peptidase